MRAVLDPDVIIPAALAPRGAPAKVLKAWLEGAFELVVSESLLAELERAMGYAKLRKRIAPDEARALVELLRREATTTGDPADPPSTRSPDPGDDYLIALAATAHAVIVSGDRHLLGLARQIPVFSPADFLPMLRETP